MCVVFPNGNCCKKIAVLNVNSKIRSFCSNLASCHACGPPIADSVGPPSMTSPAVVPAVLCLRYSETDYWSYRTNVAIFCSFTVKYATPIACIRVKGKTWLKSWQTETSYSGWHESWRMDAEKLLVVCHWKRDWCEGPLKNHWFIRRGPTLFSFCTWSGEVPVYLSVTTNLPNRKMLNDDLNNWVHLQDTNSEDDDFVVIL